MQTPLSVAQAVAVLTNNPNIFYIEPDYILQPQAMPNDYYLGLEWGLHNTGQDIRNVLGLPDADIDMPEAWKLADGEGVVVAFYGLHHAAIIAGGDPQALAQPVDRLAVQCVHLHQVGTRDIRQTGVWKH